MSEHEQIGRLALRHEGANWNAYYARTHTMDGALFLGSIAMAAVDEKPDRREAFLSLMRDVVSDLIEAKAGIRPRWLGPTPAPAHERSGEA